MIFWATNFSDTVENEDNSLGTALWQVCFFHNPAHFHKPAQFPVPAFFAIPLEILKFLDGSFAGQRYFDSSPLF